MAAEPVSTVAAAPWFGRARQFPVFSREWFRHRSMAHVAGLLLLFAVSVVIFRLNGEEGTDRAWQMAKTFLPLSAFSIAGPFLATLVRERGWTGGRELAGLVAALVLGGLLAAGVVKGTSMLSEQVGLTARLEKARIARNPAAATQAPISTARMMGMVLAAGLLVCWLGGGFALVTHLRQRRTALAQAVAIELAGAREARNRAELKLAVLAAQVEPHFLFNTLAGVRSAIHVDPLRATTMIDHMVDYLRATIPQLRGHGDAVKADLASQLEAARAYLGLMHARLPRMAFSVSAAPGLDRACLPPLLLISLVENAVKHGIEPKIGAGMVEVKARANDEGQLLVTVSDDGVGFGGATSGTGIGLANVSARLEAIYGPRGSLTLSANPGGGVVAAIAIPLEEYLNEEGNR
jgi:hypothetical protein